MNATMNSPKSAEIVRGYYSELISYMKGAHQAVEKASAEIPEAEQLLRKTQSLYEQSIAGLKDIAGRRFGEATAGDKVKDGVAKTTGTLASLFSGLGSHECSKQLRDHYAPLTDVSCGYSMLYATDVAGYGRTPESAELLKLMRRHNELVIEYGHVIPLVVITELNQAEDGSFNDFDTQAVVGEIQSTWH